MTEEQIALAKRAVECRGWRWMPGMLTDSKFARVVAADENGAPCAAEQGATEDDCCAVWLDGVPVLPDLTDPATLGCLLALVREACGDPSLSVLFDHDGRKWRVGRWEDDGLALRCHHADTEAEALVVTLEVNEIVGIIAAAETVS